MTHSKLFYRQLDIEKSNALKRNKGNFEATMQISQESRTDLKWFLDNLNHAFVDVSGKNPDFVLKTDASNSGWGGLLQKVDSNTIIAHTRGQWTSEETALHINLKELWAVYHSLLSLCPDKHDVVIKICSDNSTTVSYIKKPRGKDFKLPQNIKTYMAMGYSQEHLALILFHSRCTKYRGPTNYHEL